MKITISKQDKLSVPGIYESSGTGLSMDFELDESLPVEQQQLQLQQFKTHFETLYWPLVAYDFQTYLNRLRTGTAQFLGVEVQQS